MDILIHFLLRSLVLFLNATTRQDFCYENRLIEMIFSSNTCNESIVSSDDDAINLICKLVEISRIGVGVLWLFMSLLFFAMRYST